MMGATTLRSLALIAACAIASLWTRAEAQTEQPTRPSQAVLAIVTPAEDLQYLSDAIGVIVPETFRLKPVTPEGVVHVERFAYGKAYYYLIGELADAKELVRFTLRLYRVRDPVPTNLETSPNRPIAEAKFLLDENQNHEQQLRLFLRYVAETVRNLNNGNSSRLLLADCIHFDDNAIFGRTITEEYARILSGMLANGWLVAGIEGADYNAWCAEAGSSYPLRGAYPNRAYGTLYQSVATEIAHNLHWEDSKDAAVSQEGFRLAATSDPNGLAEEIAKMFLAHVAAVAGGVSPEIVPPP